MKGALTIGRFRDSARDEAAGRALTRAPAGDDGVAHFTGTWPGTRKFRVDAIGFEPEQFEAKLEAGKSTHVGTISLRPATGTITVRALLPEGRQGGEFRVWLYVRGASLLRSATNLQADGTAVLERIPTESIQVFINPHPRGGPGWFRMVNLAPGERADVTIDLSREPGRQED